MEVGFYALSTAVQNPLPDATATHDWRCLSLLPAGLYVVAFDQLADTSLGCSYIALMRGRQPSRHRVYRYHALWPVLAEHLRSLVPSDQHR